MRRPWRCSVSCCRGRSAAPCVHCEHAEHESLSGAGPAVQPEKDSLDDAARPARRHERASGACRHLASESVEAVVSDGPELAPAAGDQEEPGVHASTVPLAHESSHDLDVAAVAETAPAGQIQPRHHVLPAARSSFGVCCCIRASHALAITGSHSARRSHFRPPREMTRSAAKQPCPRGSAPDG